jgi:hypothetical protein
MSASSRDSDSETDSDHEKNDQDEEEDDEDEDDEDEDENQDDDRDVIFLSAKSANNYVPNNDKLSYDNKAIDEKDTAEIIENVSEARGDSNCKHVTFNQHVDDKEQRDNKYMDDDSNNIDNDNDNEVSCYCNSRHCYNGRTKTNVDDSNVLNDTIDANDSNNINKISESMDSLSTRSSITSDAIANVNGCMDWFFMFHIGLAVGFFFGAGFMEQVCK